MAAKTLVCFGFLFTQILWAAYGPSQRPYQVLNYQIRFEMDPRLDSKELTVETEITAKAIGPMTAIELDVDGLTIQSVGTRPIKKPLSFEILNKKILSVRLDRPHRKGETFRMVVRSTAPIGLSHEGLFKVTDPDDPDRGNLYFTMFEPEMARSVFPCNDEPHDKATTGVTARLPAEFTLISNGKKIRDVSFKKNGENWREVQWQMHKPHSTYLVSFAIGKFSMIKDETGGKEVSVYTSKGKLDKARYAMESTRKSLQFFEKYLGTPYPWPKYATIAIPTYLWGGMENTSATHMNQERTLLNDPASAYEKKRITQLAAHELAHQWFGDYVTMKWWDDIWLNEAFASFLATIATRDAFKTDEAEIEFVTDLWDSYFREEDGPRSHPVVDPNLTAAGDAFDSTNYTKGEAILRMLEAYIGPSKFQRGMKDYLSRFAFSNATNTDFLDVMAKVSGEKLAGFRKSWLLERGYPILTYGGKWENGTYKLHVAQKPNQPKDSHLFDFKLPVVFHRQSAPAYTQRVVIPMSEKEKTIDFTLPAEPEWINLNERAVVLASVRPETSNETSISQQVLNDPDPFSRLWATQYVLSPLLKGEKLSSAMQKLIVKSLNEDPSPYVRNAVLQTLQRIPGTMPDAMGAGVLELAKSALGENYAKSGDFKTDTHGWLEFRSELIGTLGKVKSPETIPLLSQVLLTADLPLDDLESGSSSIAMTGDERALDVLNKALALHGSKGYRYRYHVVMAYGALENTGAVKEIEKLAETTSPDVMGRIGRRIQDNHKLKSSAEWAGFIRNFVVKNARFSEEVKARLLHTIEEVKTSPVKEALKTIAEQSESDRLKELAKKMLAKNFS